MVSWRRWFAVGAGVAVLVAAPAAIGALPARQDPISAPALLAAVQRSGSVGYSGYAEAVGGLRLPVTEEFTSLVDLFGDRTRLRVWRRSDQDWRVDAIDSTGETDVHRTASGTWTWEYEPNRATFAGEPPVRLPRRADLDPAQLGRRLLSEAVPSEVTRMPSRRIAGRDAPGLRLRPDDPNSTITRVDAWADPATGLVLRVAMYGTGLAEPALQSTFLDVDTRTPDQAITRFRIPAGGRVSINNENDLVGLINEFGPYPPPSELAGYPMRERVDGLGAVGTYGRGVTVLAALRLPGGASVSLLDTLSRTPGAKAVHAGTLLTVGPLSLLLATGITVAAADQITTVDDRVWLLAGTVTPATLQRAAADLTAHPPRAR
jgi:hypothetical protein